MSMKSLLVVEDDSLFAAGLVSGLTKEGFDVELANNGANGISLALKNKSVTIV